MRPSSVVLPAPVRADDGGGGAGLGGERDLVQHRRLGARVGEVDVAQLDRRRTGRRCDGLGRAGRTVESVSSTS